METMQTLEKWQDEFLTMMKKVETPVVRFTGERAETMARVLPDRPAFMTHLPSMTELVDNQLKFRRRLVDEYLRDRVRDDLRELVRAQLK